MKRTSTVQSTDPHRWWARAFGGIFLASAVTHATLVMVTPHSYEAFANGSWWPFVRHAWHSVFVPNTAFFITLLIMFEAAVGLLILSRYDRRTGIAAAIVFNAALILFGWGFCIWSVPAIALLLWFWHLENSSTSDVGAPHATGLHATPTPQAMGHRVLR
jgi:hypothetical protein